MATISGIFTIDYANTITIPSGTGFLLVGASTGILQIGKRRLFMISLLDPTPGAVSDTTVHFTMGLSTGTHAPTPDEDSPMLSSSQNLVFDTGDTYDQIQLYNGDNANQIVYSVVLLSKF